MAHILRALFPFFYYFSLAGGIKRRFAPSEIFLSRGIIKRFAKAVALHRAHTTRDLMSNKELISWICSSEIEMNRLHVNCIKDCSPTLGNCVFPFAVVAAPPLFFVSLRERDIVSRLVYSRAQMHARRFCLPLFRAHTKFKIIRLEGMRRIIK